MNRDKQRLLLSEYGRNVQTMVAYLKTIEDRDLRNRQAEVVVAVMGNVNPAQKDSEGFQHMLWDHLFMIADFDLDVDAPYPKPTPDMFAPRPHPMERPQSYIAQKQYGANVKRMLGELAQVPAGPERDAAAANVAKYMKQKSYEYNKEFPSNEVVIADIRQMSRGEIALDADTLDNTRIDTSAVMGARGQNGRNNKNSRGNSGTSGGNSGYPQKKHAKRSPAGNK